MANTSCYVKIEDGSLPVELLVKSKLGQEGTIIKFYSDIYAGYAKVKKLPSGFEVIFRKEPPESVLWGRVDRHPFTLNNPNHNILNPNKILP